MPAMNMQKKLAESRKPTRQPEPAPDLTNFMNDDWFFGTAHKEVKAYNMTGRTALEVEGDRGGRNSNSKLTQEWLEEARRAIASSPSRFDSPTRRSGSPRFAAPDPSVLDRRDPLSRSARRNRAGEGISGEILSRHNLNKSESFRTEAPPSPVTQWFNKIDTKSSTGSNDDDNRQDDGDGKLTDSVTCRKSRFQHDPSNAQTQSATPPKPITRRTFKTAVEAQQGKPRVLSPPKHLVESAHRRSISSSTCSLAKLSKAEPQVGIDGDVSFEKPADIRLVDDVGRLNLFLKEQRVKMGKISRGEVATKAKIVLCGTSNTTSSLVAAICYAWLLEKKERREEGREVAVPVISMKRERMWKHKQAAWLLYHVGVDASSLLFSDEVDLEGLLMSRQLSILVVGQDVLRTNGEVGSQCTVLTDNYCEDAYDLLQTPYMKKLLLAGILSDTDNLNLAAKTCTNRDAEAVQLLLVGSSPNLRHELHDQLMQDQPHKAFLEAMQYNYGSPSNTNNTEETDEGEERRPLFFRPRQSNSAHQQNTNIAASEKNKILVGENTPRRPSASSNKNPGNKINQSPAAPAPTTGSQEPAVSRPKNKFFLAKWLGFGSK